MSLALLNPVTLRKLAGLAQEFGDLKAVDVEAAHLRKLAEVIGAPEDDAVIDSLMRVAHGEPLGVSAVQWAIKLFQSGQLEQYVGENGEQMVLDRCAFCNQPNNVPKPPQGESIHYRCVFCELPNTIQPL